jgi:RNase adaptor protein for sRNA GlmZ degradation
VLTLTSFGFLHGQPPKADRVEDVRERLRDPAAARDIIDLDGRDARVQQVVAGTPGALDLIDNLVAYALTSSAPPQRIAIGCSGGRHRAPALVEMLAERLRAGQVRVEVEHLHVHLPILRRADATPEAVAR